MNLAYPSLGAIWLGQGRCSFRVWAPNSERVDVHLINPKNEIIALRQEHDGYHAAVAENVPHNSQYFIRIDGDVERPDPASRWQPEGVHGPSQVMVPDYNWTDHGWFGLLLKDYIIYELHVGTFSPEGTFDGVIQYLPQLKSLGITAIELMPVAQFPGTRNWGYDGVYPFAVHNSYGGPEGLKRLVNAAHQEGLAVVLDVVYNHLGPEGNYLPVFAPYFTDFYQTPWGAALNYDGPCSREVRRFFIENALYWQSEFHLDALRLDAVHAIHDFSAIPFLEELAESAHQQAEELNRRFHLIAESDLNMARHILPRVLGGYGLDAQWSDDFHHSLHVLLTGEHQGYYLDFRGIKCLSKAFQEGYVYTGEYSQYRRQRHGSSPRLLSAKQFVVCSQNHDQIGNRMTGDRLGPGVSFERQKLAAGTVLLSPFIPLLFMGEEYGETAPFQYFVSHSDPELVTAVRKGRLKEFQAFHWQCEVPDPQSEETYLRCKLNWSLMNNGAHSLLRRFYAELIRLRKSIPAIARAEKDSMEVREVESKQIMLVHYGLQDDTVIVAYNFDEQRQTMPLTLAPGRWRRSMDSAALWWNGPGNDLPEEFNTEGSETVQLSPTSFLVLQKS